VHELAADPGAHPRNAGSAPISYQTPFDGKTGLGMAAEYKLQTRRAGALIAELGHVFLHRPLA
jgi:hypothetical protein